MLELKLREIEEAAKGLESLINEFRNKAEVVLEELREEGELNASDIEELIFRTGGIQGAYVIIVNRLELVGKKFMNTNRISNLRRDLFESLEKHKVWIPILEQWLPQAEALGLTPEIQQYQLDHGMELAAQSFPKHWEVTGK